VAANGAIYVADGAGERLFELRDGIFASFMQNSRVSRSLGLAAAGNELFASVRNRVLGIDLKTQSIRTVIRDVDVASLVAVGDGALIAADRAGTLYLLDSGEEHRLLATRAGETELCFVASENLLLVSASGSNRLTAYRLTDSPASLSRNGSRAMPEAGRIVAGTN
jgi:sugar lactone lactonase YvrE